MLCRMSGPQGFTGENRQTLEGQFFRGKGSWRSWQSSEYDSENGELERAGGTGEGKREGEKRRKTERKQEEGQKASKEKERGGEG